MNFSFASFKPFAIADAKVTVIDMAMPNLYFDLLRSFKDATDLIQASDEDWEPVPTNKAFYWLGDLMLNVDLNKLFLHKIYSRFSEIAVDEWGTLADEARQLRTHILDTSYLLDLPLEVEPVMTLESVIKGSGLTISEQALSDPYDKIETLVKIASEINEQRVLVLTNVSHYLNVTQLCHLEEVVNSRKIPLLLIEFSNCNRKPLFKNCEYTYIDSDFVDWR